MFQDTEEEILVERNVIKNIAYHERSQEDKKRLNDLETELLRRHPERNIPAQQAIGKDGFPIISFAAKHLWLTTFPPVFPLFTAVSLQSK